MTTTTTTAKPNLAFDIDETLSNTVLYYVQEMQKRFGNPEFLSAEEIIQKYRYTQDVPYWNNEKAREWVQKAIYNDELQEKLPLIQQSEVYAPKVAEILNLTCYLTIRPESVVPGTKKWLDTHKFPEAQIIAKPFLDNDTAGSVWKAKKLLSLSPKIEAIVDDNIALVQTFDNLETCYPNRNQRGIDQASNKFTI